MLDFICDILFLIIGPRGWRELSGPAVVAGVIVWSVVGAVATATGWAALARANATDDRVFAWIALIAGLLVLGDVVIGTITFFRANRERA